MATNKRMFSNDIVGSDAFLEMPPSTQALYFHLGMRADDDGFANPKMVMRMLGSSEDELKVLVGKKFVLPFEDGVLVIKHWRINNNKIQGDRYKPTLYQDKLKSLYIKENGVYTLDLSQSVNRPLTQNRIEENRIEEKNIQGVVDEDFEKFYKLFPSRRKGGKKAPWLKWQKLSDEDKTIVLQDIVKRSKEHGDWLKQNGDFIPAPEVYLNKQQWLMPIIAAQELSAPRTVDRFTV